MINVNIFRGKFHIFWVDICTRRQKLGAISEKKYMLVEKMSKLLILKNENGTSQFSKIQDFGHSRKTKVSFQYVLFKAVD